MLLSVRSPETPPPNPAMSRILLTLLQTASRLQNPMTSRQATSPVFWCVNVRMGMHIPTASALG